MAAPTVFVSFCLARKHVCSVMQRYRGKGIQRMEASDAGYRGRINPCFVPPLADGPLPYGVVWQKG